MRGSRPKLWMISTGQLSRENRTWYSISSIKNGTEQKLWIVLQVRVENLSKIFLEIFRQYFKAKISRPVYWFWECGRGAPRIDSVNASIDSRIQRSAESGLQVQTQSLYFTSRLGNMGRQCWTTQMDWQRNCTQENGCQSNKGSFWPLLELFKIFSRFWPMTNSS